MGWNPLILEFRSGFTRLTGAHLTRVARMVAITLLSVFSIFLIRSVLGFGPESCNCFGQALGLPLWANRIEVAIIRNVLMIVAVALTMRK